MLKPSTRRALSADMGILVVVGLEIAGVRCDTLELRRGYERNTVGPARVLGCIALNNLPWPRGTPGIDCDCAFAARRR